MHASQCSSMRGVVHSLEVEYTLSQSTWSKSTRLGCILCRLTFVYSGATAVTERQMQSHLLDSQ